MKPLDYVTEQLWAPVLASSDTRLVVDTPADDTWRDLERYWLIPREASARLLVPAGSREMVGRYLGNYRHLRKSYKSASRLLLSRAVQAGLPVSRTSVALQTRVAGPVGSPGQVLSDALGQPVYAALGVRTSDNRKATLQLVDGEGHPVGFAKFGWSPTTDALVANETAALKRVGGRPGPTRAPAVLAEVDYHGHPVVVTEAMPVDVRGGPSGAAEPTPAEMYALMPVSRRGAVGTTGEFEVSTGRLRSAESAPATAEVAAAGLRLAGLLGQVEDPVPVTELCHGDMAPWNRAREASGQLWLWDWEYAEEDAVAGIDPLNWMFSRHRIATGHTEEVRLSDWVDRAGGYLTAAGVSHHDRPLVAAAYAVHVVGRACSIASHSGSWAEAVLGPAGLHDLLGQATALLEAR